MTKVWYPPYRKFRCLKAECPMNCCGYYAIRIFKKEKGLIDPSFLERDGDGVRCRSRKEGGCIFWTDGRLCSLQLDGGEEAMPAVCRTYPRIIGRYGDRIEFGLEPCCPVVAASVEDWNIGELLVEREAGETSDEVAARRDEAVRILADRNLDFRQCLKRLAELYRSDVRIPEITVGGETLEFLRRVTALMCWSYLRYFHGVAEVDNLMTVIITAVSRFMEKNAGCTFASRWEMALSFSRLLVKYYLEIGFDIDHEDRYCDILEYGE